VANDRLKAEGWRPTVTNEQAYVEGTEGKWWTMVTPKRRQELSLGGLGVLLDAVSGVAVLEPASDSGATPFTVAGCSPGDHVRVLGDTPFEADLTEAEGGHMRLDADGWAREGTPVVDRLGHLVGLYSTTARGQELLRVDRVSGVAPTSTTDPSSTTSTVAPSSSLTAPTSSEVTSTGPTTTQAGTTTSTVAPTTTLRAMPVWLGVQADETPSGLTVTAVADGGPAAAAGVTAGDVVIALAGVPVSVRADVAGVLGARAPGDTISVTVLRDGTRLDLSAVLAPRPSL
jgi:predicted metalloprotease with PDZ domain